MSVTPFRYLADEVDVRAGERRPELLSVSISRGVVPRSSLVDGAPRADDLSIYKVCQPGDIVLNRMSAYQGALGIARQEGLVSPDYAVLRPNSNVSRRYLTYVMKSSWFVGQMTERLRGIGGAGNAMVRTPRVSVDSLGDVQVSMPVVEEQRRIADFLDDCVARIDQIIAGRRQQLALLGRAVNSEAAHLISAAVPGPPLSALARIIDTEHKTAPSTPHGGYWIAGTNAIREGVVVPSELREIDADAYGEWTVRGRPRPGDVLLTREAPVGQVALLGDQDTRIAIGQRVVLLQPTAGALDPAFLRLVLMCGALRPVIEQASAGSLHPHLNMADISRLRIPDLAFDRQVSLGREHRSLLEQGNVRSGELSRQAVLLQEYKQSLITAAVTGELDVTTASSRIPE